MKHIPNIQFMLVIDKNQYPDNTTYNINAVEDFYVFNGQGYTGTDALGKICRELKTGKANILRDGVIVATVNIEKRSKKSLRESDARGLHETKYAPFPDHLK